MTLEECKAAWAEAGHPGSREERIARSAKWLSFYSFLAGRETPEKPESHWESNEIANFLFDEGVVRKEDTVLDIGSGTGSFALPFAKRCTGVTALEMEPDSLDLLVRRAALLGLQNVAAVHDVWENFRSLEKYDTVFSAMCPAICDYDELLRMESMAKRCCVILAVARGSADYHRQKLMREVFHIKPNGGMNSEASWYYNMLYLMERQPNVKTFTHYSKSALPAEYLVERNKIYFEIFDIPAAKSEPILRDYYASVAENGMVSDETKINNALIWWQVP